MNSAPPQPPSVAVLHEAALRQLIGAGAVDGVVAVGGQGGFVLELKLGTSEAVLGNSRGKPRMFASLGTIALLLKRMGRPRFQVDVANFVQGRVRPPQPERSASMRAGRLPQAGVNTPSKAKKEKQA